MRMKKKRICKIECEKRKKKKVKRKRFIKNE